MSFPSFQKFTQIDLRNWKLEARGVWLFLALAAGILVRGYFLSQPMRGDEAYTFLQYVNNGVRSLFDYSAPNNHVFNTLLIKLSTSLWGGSPAAIRFPAFAAGLAVILIGFYLAGALLKNKNSGVLAAIGLAVFPYLVLYSTNARGYSMIVAFSLLMAVVAYRFSHTLSKLALLLLALLAALGMWTIPVMILPIAGIFFWVVGLLRVEKRSVKTILSRFAVPFALMSAALTLAFYAPVIYVSKGAASIVSNKFVRPQSWSAFWAGILPQLQKSLDEIFRDIPPLVLFVLLALALLGLMHSIRSRNWGLLLLLPCLLLGAVCVVLIQHTAPYARTWIYLIPFILLLADAVLVFLLDHLPGRLSAWVNTLLVFAGFFFAMRLMSGNIIAAYPDTSAFPEAPIAVQYLKPVFKPGDTLRITSTADWSVYFYFWYDGISPSLTQKSPSTGRIFYIVKKSRGSVVDMGTPPDALLLEVGDMALYQGRR